MVTRNIAERILDFMMLVVSSCKPRDDVNHSSIRIYDRRISSRCARKVRLLYNSLNLTKHVREEYLLNIIFNSIFYALKISDLQEFYSLI